MAGGSGRPSRALAPRAARLVARLRGGWRWAAAGLTLALALLLALAASRTRLTAPAPTRLLLDRHGEFLAEVAPPGQEGLGYWPLAELPERVVAATLAAEDRRFWSHPGVDPLAVTRAAFDNLRHRRVVSGASTLAMQVARMQTPGPRTFRRKAVESLTALLLTARHGRREVLRHYLRIVPYGHRIHGIAYAARRYLDKPVEDLSWAETALLAALPQAPARMDPLDPLGRARAVRRGREILRRLAAGGRLSPAELASAEAEILSLHLPPWSRRPEAALHAVLRLEERLGEGEWATARVPDLRIETTLDLDLQRRLAWQTWLALGEWQARGAGNAALLVVDRRSWEVLAAVGSADYFDARYAGAIDYLQVERSSGSILKPFLYALALERGLLTPATLLDDLGPGLEGIRNADGRFLGPMLPRFALANSRNVPAVRLLARVRVDEAYAFLRELGLHDGREPSRRYGLGLAIGALPVTLEELVEAYTVLAGDGRRQALRWLRRQAPAPARRLVSEETARLVTLFLADPQARLPSFPRMGVGEYPFAVALKTGTSSHFWDAWTVAYSARYLVGVWVGHPDHRPMSGLTGYTSAAYLAREVLDALHPDQQDGLDGLPFPPPRGYRAQRLCALSGRRATSACDRVSLEWLPPGGEVIDACPVHRLLAVDRRNGLLASAAVPPREVEVRAFAEFPPRYAAWASAAGLPRPPRQVSPLGGGGAAGRVPVPRPARAGALAGGTAGHRQTSAEPRVEITSPQPGARLLFDPEAPAARNTVALQAVVAPAAAQVVWYVDGQPFRTVDHPFTTRWPLTAGEHTFQVEVPFTPLRSARVRIRVE